MDSNVDICHTQSPWVPPKSGHKLFRLKLKQNQVASLKQAGAIYNQREIQPWSC